MRYMPKEANSPADTEAIGYDIILSISVYTGVSDTSASTGTLASKIQ